MAESHFESIDIGGEKQSDIEYRKIVITYDKITGKLTVDPGDETQPTVFVFNGIKGALVERQR